MGAPLPPLVSVNTHWSHFIEMGPCHRRHNHVQNFFARGHQPHRRGHTDRSHPLFLAGCGPANPNLTRGLPDESSHEEPAGTSSEIQAARDFIESLQFQEPHLSVTEQAKIASLYAYVDPLSLVRGR